jgi:DNA-binding CsgD family transcriptional regulator
MAGCLDLSQLMDGVSTLLASAQLADHDIGEALGRVMSALVEFDFMVVFAYREAERPIDLYSTFGPEDYRVFVSLYQQGPYLLDPFYHAARGKTSGARRMSELAPDRFFSSEYFRSYYTQTRLAEEIGFFVPLDEGITVVLSLMRKTNSRMFSTREWERLKQAQRFVDVLVRRYWRDLERRFVEQARRGQRKPGSALARAGGRGESVWGRLNLTAREAAIVDLVLQGYSSEAVGRRLNVATGTVKVHRRNVYRKLGISSQTQLLSLYLRHM